MVTKCKPYISHVAEDENLPEEVEDFKELQIIKKRIKRILKERVRKMRVYVERQGRYVKLFASGVTVQPGSELYIYS